MRQLRLTTRLGTKNFNPRTPHGVRRAVLARNARRARHFNPRTPHGVRRYLKVRAYTVPKFQSTHPSRGATRLAGQRFEACINFNPRTPHGVRLLKTVQQNEYEIISIHAPLTGCDAPPHRARRHARGISIHAPLTGCDLRTPPKTPRVSVFQSTHPSRGATTRAPTSRTRGLFQSTHPSRGATRTHDE